MEETITLKTYLFGVSNQIALNQILIELKKMFFYSWDPTMQINDFFNIFISKIRKLMIIEKQLIISTKGLDQYIAKWDKFKNIYDFNGPDIQIY